MAVTVQALRAAAVRQLLVDGAGIDAAVGGLTDPEAARPATGLAPACPLAPGHGVGDGAEARRTVLEAEGGSRPVSCDRRLEDALVADLSGRTASGWRAPVRRRAAPVVVRTGYGETSW